MRILLVTLLLVSAPAFAWPVDFYFDLEQGEPRMHRLSVVEWVETKDPEIAVAEILPSGDLLLSPKRPGRTLLLLYAQGKFAVWRIRVTPEGTHAPEVPDVTGPLAAAEKACPGLKAELAGGDPMQASLTVAVKTSGCHQALAPLLATDAFRARRLDVTFELEQLQAQLAEFQAKARAIVPDGKLELSYSGAGLVVKGELTREQHRALLWALFHASTGTVPLDDQVTKLDPLSDPKPPAGR